MGHGGRGSPKRTAPQVEPARVDAGVLFEEPLGEKARSAGAAHEYDPVMIDSERGIESALQQLVDEAPILRDPTTRSGAADDAAEQISNLGSPRGCRRGQNGRCQPQVERVVGVDPINTSNIVGRALVGSMEENKQAARFTRIPAASEPESV